MPIEGIGTPIKIGSISKNLLTPCRRVGLCRKIMKTPKITSTPQSTSTLTPITKSLDVAIDIKLPISNNKSVESMQKITSSRGSRAKKNLKLEKSVPKSATLDKLVVTSETELPLLHSKQGTVVAEKVSLNAVENVNPSNDKICKGNKNSEHNYLDTENENNKTVSKRSFTNITNTTVKKHNLIKRLSMKRTSTSDDTSDLEDPMFTDSSAAVETNECLVANSENSESADESVEIKVVANKSKRKMIYSSDEDDFVPSQKSSTENCEGNGENLQDKIVAIKQQIETKRAHLENLNQASVYKKLHNIDELNELTDTWRKGCHNALLYLLVKLQSHGSMTMSTLLRNLNIPKELIDFDENNDCFI